jgi:hypothetical protein
MERLTEPMSRHSQRRLVLATAALAAALAGSTCDIALAQGKLDARYQVTLGGVAFGRGGWQINVTNDQFSTAVTGTTTGLLRLFNTGRGASASRGSVAGGQLSATSYSSSIATDRRYDEVRMQMSAGTVKSFVAEPPNIPDPQRVPLQEHHRRGVLDPLTGAIIRVPGNGDTFVPQACNRKLPIFDGRMRYDLQLSYKRLEKVRSERGYQGTAVACAVYFTAVAGHVPSRPVIRYLTDLRDAEIWLAPIAGTRLMVPHRILVPTPFGLGVVQATEFMSTPQTGRTTATPTSVQPH